MPPRRIRGRSAVGGDAYDFACRTNQVGGGVLYWWQWGGAETKSEVDVRLWGRQRMMTTADIRDDEDGGRRYAGGHD